MDEKLETKLVARRSIYRGRIVHLDVDRVIEPSGQEVEREVIRHGGAAVLLAVTNEGRVVLVRQYRYASGELMLEVPAGTIEPGESPDETARRELVEETGYYPNRLEKLTEFFPSPGILTELMHLYLATDLDEREASPDDDENLELVELSINDALALQVGKDLRDAKTIIALSYLRTLPVFASSRKP